jgi:2-polyprenyl-3-methyl-5-hydroxy-6-metoxy-1,4-benzoquinol methylase
MLQHTISERTGQAMDQQTISAYDTASEQYAKDWGDQPAPTDLYDLLRKHFKPGLTVDIGCGSGRDVAWLAASGFEATGYDASEGLLKQAKALHPGLIFGLATLPELTGLRTKYQNVLCETAIMHLDPKLIGPATRRLLSLLLPSGTLFISWRVTESDSMRDKNGRLYAAFDKRLVIDELKAETILLDKEDVNLSSGKKVHRVIVRKTSGA